MKDSVSVFGQTTKGCMEIACGLVFQAIREYASTFLLSFLSCVFQCDTLGHLRSFALVTQDSARTLSQCTIGVPVYKDAFVIIFQDPFAFGALFWPPFKFALNGILHRGIENKYEMLAIMLF